MILHILNLLVEGPLMNPGVDISSWSVKSSRAWLFPAIAGILSGLLCLPLLGLGFTFDQGVFSTIADTMLRGGAVYKDAWEHKPPGVFYAYYLAFVTLGREIWAVRILEMVTMALSSAGLFRLVERRSGSSLAAGVASLMLPLLYLVFGQNTAQAESFQIPFIIWAWLFWPNRGDTFGVVWKCFLSGMLISIAALFKTPSILFNVVLIAERLYWDRKEVGLFGKLRLSMISAAGMIVPPALILTYYLAKGAGAALFDAMVLFPSRYASVSVYHSSLILLRHFVSWVIWLMPAGALFLMIIGWVRGWRVRRGETLRWTIFFLTSWGIVAIQGRYYPYHHLPMLPALAWGSGLLFSAKEGDPPPGDGPAARPTRLILVTSSALLSFSLVQCCWWIWPGIESARSPARFDRANGIPDPNNFWRGQREIARRIRELTRPDERIFVCGDEPLIYPMADRRLAGRNCHLMQVVPPWEGGERLGPLIDRLREEKPRLILVCADNLWWRNGQSSLDLLRKSPAMMEFITTSYTHQEDVLGYELWTLAR
jgi:hypothetical protein